MTGTCGTLLLAPSAQSGQRYGTATWPQSAIDQCVLADKTGIRQKNKHLGYYQLLLKFSFFEACKILIPGLSTSALAIYFSEPPV